MLLFCSDWLAGTGSSILHLLLEDGEHETDSFLFELQDRGSHKPAGQYVIANTSALKPLPNGEQRAAKGRARSLCWIQLCLLLSVCLLFSVAMRMVCIPHLLVDAAETVVRPLDSVWATFLGRNNPDFCPARGQNFGNCSSSKGFHSPAAASLPRGGGAGRAGLLFGPIARGGHVIGSSLERDLARG